MSFKGIITDQSTGQRSFTAPLGFRGITLEYPLGLRFIKVTDFRGTPISGAVVTVKNTAADYIQTTNETGIAAVEVDISGTKTVLLKKDKTNLSITFTFSTDPLTKVIVLQPRLLL